MVSLCQEQNFIMNFAVSFLKLLILYILWRAQFLSDFYAVFCIHQILILWPIQAKIWDLKVSQKFKILNNLLLVNLTVKRSCDLRQEAVELSDCQTRTSGTRWWGSLIAWMKTLCEQVCSGSCCLGVHFCRVGWGLMDPDSRLLNSIWSTPWKCWRCIILLTTTSWVKGVAQKV